MRPEEPPAVSRVAQAARREQADDVPPEAQRHQRRPAVSRGDPLLEEPLPGGGSHGQDQNYMEFEQKKRFS